MQRLSPSSIQTGPTLTRIRRAVFVLGADLSTGGSLELSFDDGQTFHLGVAGNGESLEILPGPWPEQFPEPVSPENREFLQTSGKWEILDLGASTWSYRQFVGRQLSAVRPIDGRGLRLDFDGMTIHVEVIADDLHTRFQ